MKLRGPYQTRSIRFHGIEAFNDWKIKVYRIFQDELTPEHEQMLAGCLEKVLAKLPQPATTEERYGVGFLIIHHGEHRNWLLLDWWFDQEILKQKLFSSPLDDPANVTEAEPDLMACTWEMAVQCFERSAWLKTVLQNSEGPDLNAYLNHQLNADV